jgi:hypothetical protein
MVRSKGGTPKTNRVTVSLDDKTHKALQAYSNRDDVSISCLIRRAVADMIEQRENENIERNRKASKTRT